MSLHDEVKALGHFFTRIHPETANKGAQVPLRELERILQTSAVQLRGWDFPHIDRNEPIERHAGSIAQAYRWRWHLESWRLYASGQFAARTAFIEDVMVSEGDWPGPRRPPDTATQSYLGVIEIAYRAAEIAHFAANLGSSPIGGESMVVKMGLVGTAHRNLYVEDPHRSGFDTVRRAHDPEVVATITVPAADLVAGPWQHAVDLALAVYERFGWDPQPELVDGVLEPLRSRNA